MFNKKSSRHSLALFVALALGSGTFLAPSAAGAADVSGQNVAIDDAHAPSDNAIDPGSNHVIGTAAGFIKDAQDGGNVTNNKLTFNGISSAYPKHLYGGLTFGAGNVTGNHVIVNSATLPLLSSIDGIFGGAANNGGNVTDNHATFNGTHLNGDLVGGMTNMSGTGTVKKNTATLKGGNVHGSIYGGLAGHGASGDVVENKVTIEGGTVTGTEKVYGGYADGNGNVKGNIVTIKGGTLSEIYGGYSDGTGEVSGNTVNLGDGTSAMAAGYAINGTIYGGKNTADPSKVSNNTLNVNTNAVAHNIKNFSTINFNFNAYTNAASSLLTLSDSAGTQIASLEQIHLSGAPLDKSDGTLIENTHGITLGAYSGAVSRTMEKTESIIDRDGTNKIGYKYYQFKGSTEAKSDSTAIWGGRSILGNTTTGNEVTVSGNHAGKKAYGGWTSGAGSTATGENAQNHSIGNKITLTGAASEVHHMTGGSTNIVGGKATGNHAILSDGRVTGTLAGGSARDGEVSGNTVEINGGRVDGTTYGGTTGGAGTAKDNKVTLSNGTVHSDIFGGVTTNGAATENKVNITGGSAAGHDVYGGFSTSGDTTGNTVDITGGSVRDVYGGFSTSGNATGNIVNITGGSVRNIDGGRSLGGNATGNTVNIGSTDAAFAGSITGIINGGSGTTYGNDYRTGNKLNVYGNATASNIRNFAEINFHFNAHVNQSASFLTLNDGGGTTIESLSDLNVDGEHGRKGVLLQNTPGSITIADGQNRRIKTSDDKELILEKSTDNKKITYEGYQFANVTEPTTVTESGVTSTWGGRSVAGNSTRKNVITVTSGTHTNIYGGWTSGSGTAAGDKSDSYENKVTLDSGATTGKLYGGYTDNDAGKAEKNIVTVNGGTVSDDIYGGITNKTTGTGDVKENKVTISGGTLTNVYGGYSAGSGEVSGNKVTATGGTGFNDVRGGYSTSGAAKGNKVTLGAVTTGAVTGGHAATAADGNEVTLTGTTVTSVTGGEGATTDNNTVNLNGGANVTGALKGGSQANGTGNTLNIKGKDNRAGQIAGFQKMAFDAAGVTHGDTMLRLTDGTAMNGVDKNMLTVSGTSAGKVTLLENNAGINFTTAVAGNVLKSETNDTMEKHVGVERNGSQITKVTYEGYQFRGKHTTTSFTESGVTSTWGGRSKAGNTTTENVITVASGTHTNIYGGWTTGSGSTAAADKQKNSTANKVKVNGSANVTGTVYGGFTNVAGGKAQNNEVTIEKNLAANIVGGKSTTGEASNNTVNLANATVSTVTGGEGATTNNNTVNLNGGANVTGALKGGSQANGTGNALNVKGMNSAGSVTGFQKMNFDATGAPTNAAMLRATGATDVNWETLTVKNAVASEKPLTLLENTNGINTNGRTGDAVKSELNADATMETNIDVRRSGSTITAITYEGYTFKGATQATTYGADTWAGRSKAGNTTQDNKLTLSDASKTYANVYGGWTTGTGTKAATDKQNNSIGNTVDYTAGTVTGTLYGGYAAVGEASGNTVNLGAVTTAANIYGGFGTVTKNNTINLKGARITGTVYGGSAANGTGNTLAVYKPSEVQDFAGVQNLHFHTDELTAGNTTPLLKLGTTTKDIHGLNIGVDRKGDAPKLKKGDKLLLMKTVGSLTTDDNIENKIEGKQGMARRYTYEIKKESTGELTATVTHAGLGDDAKSPVETRAGLSNLVNQGADYIVESGMSAAETALRADAGAGSSAKSDKSAQRKTAATDNASYQLWAGAGANTMRVESGSYVDSKGWSLGIGWAREDEMKDGAKRLFSPFVEYGRGTYDSYLDNGAHGSGTIRYLGIGVLGKLTQKDGLWLEGSVRGGRATSDYQLHGSSDANYDGSNTYYGIHLGIGKTVKLKKDATIDAYARYFWSHQNGMSVKLSSGDDYDFASVDSHRLRLGFRYSQKDQQQGEFYTGLAWEYEFDGEARASIGGDAAPSPSLKGSSTMLELGYRFMPKNSRVSYDLHLNGWQGKRKGITGGASVKWAF